MTISSHHHQNKVNPNHNKSFGESKSHYSEGNSVNHNDMKNLQQKSKNLLLLAKQNILKAWDIQIDPTHATDSLHDHHHQNSNSKSLEYVCTAKSEKLIPLPNDLKSNGILDVCWDDKGKYIAQLLKNGVVSIIDYQTGQIVHNFKTLNSATRCSFIKQTLKNNQICISGGSTAQILDATSGKCLHEFNLQTFNNQLTSKNNHLSSTSNLIHALGVMTHRIVTATVEGAVYTHSLRDNKTHQLTTTKKQKINSLSCSPFKRWIIAVGDQGILYMWDINRGAQPFYQSSIIHHGPILFVAFSPVNKNSYCTVGADRKIKMHNMTESGKHETLWESTIEDEPTCLTLNGDGMIAIGTQKGRVFIYDVHWKDPIKIIDAASDEGPIAGLKFHPDAKRSVVIDSENVHLQAESLKPTEKTRVGQIQKDKNILDVFSPVATAPKSFMSSKQDLNKLTGKTNLTSAFVSASNSKSDLKSLDTDIINTQRKDIKSALSLRKKLLSEKNVESSYNTPNLQLKSGSDTSESNTSLKQMANLSNAESTPIGKSLSQRLNKRIHSTSSTFPSKEMNESNVNDVSSSLIKPSNSSPRDEPDVEASISQQDSTLKRTLNSSGDSLPGESASSNSLKRALAQNKISNSNSSDGKEAVMDRVRKLLDRKRTRSPPIVPLQNHPFGGMVGHSNDELTLAQVKQSDLPMSLPKTVPKSSEVKEENGKLEAQKVEDMSQNENKGEIDIPISGRIELCSSQKIVARPKKSVDLDPSFEVIEAESVNSQESARIDLECHSSSGMSSQNRAVATDAKETPHPFLAPQSTLHLHISNTANSKNQLEKDKSFNNHSTLNNERDLMAPSTSSHRSLKNSNQSQILESSSSKLNTNENDRQIIHHFNGNQGSGGSQFQYQMIESIVEESLSKLKLEMRNDLLNVHLEMIKQFYQQKEELEELITNRSAVQPLLEEIQRLKEENERLKSRFFL